MTRYIFLLVALMGLLINASCNGSSSTVLIRDNGTISGTVVDVSSEDPVPGVAVTITSVPFINDPTGTGTIVTKTTTDQNGQFTRSDIPIGTITVHVSRNGFRTPDDQVWALAPEGFATFLFEIFPGEDPLDQYEDGDDQNAWPPDYVPPGQGG